NAIDLACGKGSARGEPATATLYNAPPGTYLLYVDGAAPKSAGTFSLEVTVRSASPPPPADTCATALPVPFAPGATTAQFQVDLSPANDDADGTCNTAKGKELVYRLTTLAPCDLRIAAARPVGNQVSDPVLYVRAAPCATGVELGCSDGAYPQATEVVRL